MSHRLRDEFVSVSAARLYWEVPDGGLVAIGVNPARARTYARLSAHVLTTLHETYGLAIRDAGLAASTVFVYTLGAVIEEQSAPGPADLDVAGDDGTRPDEAGPGETGSDQTGPGETRPALIAYLSSSVREELEAAAVPEETTEDRFKASIRFMLAHAGR